MADTIALIREEREREQRREKRAHKRGEKEIEWKSHNRILCSAASFKYKL